MKKIFGFLLMIISCFFVMNTVEATDLTKIRIGANSYNLSDVITNSEGETVSLPENVTWNNSSKTITLNNYNGESIIADNNGEDLKI